MAKVLKCKVYYEKLPGRTHYYGYPEGSSGTTQVQWLSESEGKEDERGTYVIKQCVVYDDQLAEQIIRDNPSDTVEVLDYKDPKVLKQINDWNRSKQPQSTRVRDEQKVIQILAKFARKEPLTPQEQNAINPDNEEPGINKSKPFDLSRFIPEAK